MHLQVHGTNTNHGVVALETTKHAVVKMLLEFFFIELIRVIIAQVFNYSNQKTCSACCQVTNQFIGLRFEQVNHHANDMLWCTKLPVNTCCSQFGKQVLVNITF